MWARLLPALLVAARVAPVFCGDDEKESEGGTPIYDIAHHTWGYQEDSKKDATFLLAFVVLVVVSLLVSWVVSHRWKVEVFPEACVILTVGLAAGFACKFTFAETHRGFFSRPLLGFDNALFFLGLLPPIIFYSGYELHPRWLFGLFWQIMGFAFKNKITTTPAVSTIGKALANLDGTGRCLSGRISPVDTLIDYFPKIALHHSKRNVSRESFGRFLGDVALGTGRLPEQIRLLLDQAYTDKLKLLIEPAGYDRFFKHFEKSIKGSYRFLGICIVIAALILAHAIRTSFSD